MDEAEFDKFATEYRAMHAANIKASGESPEYFAEYKIVDIARDAAALGALPAQPRVLDFGAGVGYSVPFFARHLPAAKVTCLDVSQKSLEVGESQHGARAEFTHFDGARIPYADATFDVALASCVFHHIPETEHVALLDRGPVRPSPSAEHGRLRGANVLLVTIESLGACHLSFAHAPFLSGLLPRAVRTRDATSQLEAIAAWCHERLSRQGDARLLVMLPGSAGERERLLADHVFAGVQRGDRQGGVVVVGRADINDVYLRIGDQLLRTGVEPRDALRRADALKRLRDHVRQCV